MSTRMLSLQLPTEAPRVRIPLTYSALSSFRDCRTKYRWRYVDCLVPIERERKLAFGGIIHQALERWHRPSDLLSKQGDLRAVLTFVDQAYAARATDPGLKAEWLLARAMVTAYAARYARETFEVIAVEKTFEVPIRNPATGHGSRTFYLQGRADGLVKRGNEFFLLEHKTSSSLDGSYLEKLWSDFQIHLYALALERALGITITGVIYNVLVKAKLQQSTGESEAEFEQRRAELIAQSKTGKSTAKRRMPESDEEFSARLAAWYARPEAFHREELILSRDELTAAESEIWELCQQLLDARRRQAWSANTAQCFAPGRTCPYVAACRAGGKLALVENFYTHAEPHAELTERTGEPAAAASF